MKNRFCIAFLIASAAAMMPCEPVMAHGYKTKTIAISHPWTFEQEGKGVDAVVGMELKNIGKAADSLLRVETAEVEKAELRDQDKKIDRIDLPPRSTLVLSDKGPHILLKGVKATLFPYNNLHLTLVFAKAGRIKVEVVVEDRPSR